ncbi:carbonic anhydrase 4-like [Brachionus plicatilis]|uniref:Carbonic anhydrase n=1 Tax=Brachionus plicatilis TaxID=10195 RepID=A0A3M7Q3B4_BRAPC|nr:carbonic anhydrase 4-like [Brachionus plicatilis]
MDYWIEKYPSCAGVLQSPINLQEAKAVYNSKLNPIKFHNYDWLVTWNVSYNGYTITANQLFNKTLTPYITGSDFKPENKYYLKEFHFHWGFNIYQGSEHHLDSNKFPLEIHLVHVSDLNEIAVIGFLFQIDNKDNDNIETLVTQVGKDQTMSSSLTTPPCTEGIIWTIYRAKINISEAQMEQFYKNEIDFNNREIQELNDRKLFTNRLNNYAFNNYLNFYKKRPEIEIFLVIEKEFISKTHLIFNF